MWSWNWLWKSSFPPPYAVPRLPDVAGLSPVFSPSSSARASSSSNSWCSSDLKKKNRHEKQKGKKMKLLVSARRIPFYYFSNKLLKSFKDPSVQRKKTMMSKNIFRLPRIKFNFQTPETLSSSCAPPLTLVRFFLKIRLSGYSSSFTNTCSNNQWLSNSREDQGILHIVYALYSR